MVSNTLASDMSNIIIGYTSVLLCHCYIVFVVFCPTQNILHRDILLTIKYVCLQ